jgi:lysophospholipase L1-like esterase
MISAMRSLAMAVAGCGVLVSVTANGQTDAMFQLQDRDRVVFLGDSNTRANSFIDLVEAYSILLFPKRRVSFFNVGIGGDTAEGGADRFDRDVLSKDPTVVFVTYGVNDLMTRE